MNIAKKFVKACQSAFRLSRQSAGVLLIQKKSEKKPVAYGLLFYKTLIAYRSGKSNRKCNVFMDKNVIKSVFSVLLQKGWLCAHQNIYKYILDIIYARCYNLIILID